MRKFRSLGSDRRGATAIEFALVASLISIAIIVGVRQLGNEVGNNFDEVANHVG